MTTVSDVELTTNLHELMPFAATLGVRIAEAGVGGVVATVSWAPERCTAGGVLHGGYIMGVVDSVGALVAVLNLPEGATTATIESKTNFFRAVTGGDLRVVATPLHIGRATIVVQTDVTRQDGKLATRTTQTQAVLTGR